MQGLNQTECAPQRQPEVHGNIDRLETIIARLEASTSNLDGRLSCVSRCNQPTNSTKPTAVDGYSSGVGSRIGVLIERLDVMAAQLSDMTDRLEV